MTPLKIRRLNQRDTFTIEQNCFIAIVLIKLTLRRIFISHAVMSRRIGQSQLQQNGFTSGNNAKSGIAEPPFRKYSQMSDSKKGSGQFNRNAKDHFSLSGDEENEDRLDSEFVLYVFIHVRLVTNSNSVHFPNSVDL